MKMMRLTSPAVSIRIMEEILTEKMLISSMAVNAQSIKTLGSTFFGIFLSILTAASRIRIPAAIFIPWKAWAIQVISRKRSR